MPIRILVNGAFGKMGQVTVQAISQHADFTLVASTGEHDDLASEIKKHQAQVVVDFTHADAVYRNAEIIIESGVHPVIGTTGLLKEQIVKLQERAAQLKLGGMIVPNFSLSAVLMMKCAQEIARYFSDVEII